jgi:hypothetical protein
MEIILLGAYLMLSVFVSKIKYNQITMTKIQNSKQLASDLI